MIFTDELIRDYQGQAIQEAYRSYYEELGVKVTNWEGLFMQMTYEGTPAILRRDKTGRIIGFIQFSVLMMTSWFFEDRYGFIQEFWIAPAFRCQGHGTALMELAEKHFDRQGICRMILTSDTAQEFYLQRGYYRDDHIVAKNNAPVYVKKLE